MLPSDNRATPLYVANGLAGLGLFAGRPYQAGEELLRFGGPLISLQLAITKGEREGDALQVTSDSYIDLEEPGVFINHSCEPNSGVRNAKQLIALRPITAGEEIVYDYSTTMSERRWTMTGHCGMRNCRQTVRDFYDLPGTLKSYYLQLEVVAPFIVEELRSKHPAACL